MYSTRQVLRALRQVNPGALVTEDRLRHALRRDRVPAPPKVAGRYVWSADDVERLCDSWRLTIPESISSNLAEAPIG